MTSWTEALRDARVPIFAVALIWLLVGIGLWFGSLAAAALT
jgi:hypothetical protein